MLRKISILSIIGLIILTIFVKNHTKKLDEKIFSIKENIIYLNSIKELAQLDHDYLSSPEKLLELHNLYFVDELIHSSRENIKNISNIEQINMKNIDKNIDE
tara:strand:+ start:386 stop:691 length:306 start_codon:yes stop_codon:yes gene_type:complete